MRTYELMVILDGDLVDASLSQARNSVRSRVDEVSTVTNDDFEANRKFAYEINHKTHGHYMVLELTAEPGALDPVERALLIADEVVRHKIIRLPDDEVERRLTERANPPKPKSEPAAERTTSEPAAPVKPEPVTTVPTPDGPDTSESVASETTAANQSAEPDATATAEASQADDKSEQQIGATDA